MSRRRGGGGEPEQVLYHPGVVAADGSITLEGGEARHARKSLRLREGDELWVTDGAGRRFRTRVGASEGGVLELAVEETQDVPPWPRRTFWLAAGVLRSTRMEWVIEKASELGATRVIPLLLDRCVARPQESGAKTERWRRLAVESLKQSRRARLMEVTDPMSLEDLLNTAPEPAEYWLADPGGEDPGLIRAPAGAPPLVLVSGPEGGLTEPEIARITDAGGRRIGLGGHRLRAETAAVTLLTAGLAASGEFAPN